MTVTVNGKEIEIDYNVMSTQGFIKLPSSTRRRKRRGKAARRPLKKR